MTCRVENDLDLFLRRSSSFRPGDSKAPGIGRLHRLRRIEKRLVSPAYWWKGLVRSHEWCWTKVKCRLWKAKVQDRALRNTSKKFNWSGGVVVNFHILDSIRKVRLYPRERKAINSKVILKSLQQYLWLIVSDPDRPWRRNWSCCICQRDCWRCVKAVSVEKQGL